MFKETEIKKVLKWDLKAVVIIYCILVALFFTVSIVTDKLPEPYHKRTIPSEITPWLN